MLMKHSVKRWLLSIIVGLAIVFLPLASSQAQTQRGKNIINERFKAVSSGPQESLIVDLTGSGSSDSQAVVSKRLRAYWLAEAKALGFDRRSKTTRQGPISTLVRTRVNGRLIVPPKRKVTRGYGGGELTISFEGFNGASLADANGNAIVIEEFLRNFYTIIKPKIEALYGKPAISSTVPIRNMGFFETGSATDVERLAFGAYNVSENRIYLPLYRSIDSIAHAFLLNIIHAFHGPLVFYYDAWEQGFARAAASLIARDPSLGFSDPTANNLYTFLPQYDLLNHPALGNNTFFPPSQVNTPIDGQFTIAKMLQPRLGMCGAAWLKVWMENTDFFRLFNEAYYARSDADPLLTLPGNTPQLIAIAAQSVTDVEGLPISKWVQRQYILDTSITGGNKLYPFVLPSENAAATGQSALIGLVYYRTLPTGDEDLLDGRAFAEYHDATGARIPSLGSGSEQAQIVDGEGFLTTLSFPSQGFDDGRITMDFSVGAVVSRAFLPSGLSGDLQVIWAGTSQTGGVNVTQIITPGGQQRSGQTSIARSGASFTLGAAFGELYKTRISRPGLSVGDVITVSRNLGDGVNWVVIKTDNAAGGITTVSKILPTNDLRLVSFPARPINANPSDMLGLPFTDFVLTQYDPLRNLYEMAVPDIPRIGPIVPGRAFWLRMVPDQAATHRITYQGELPATDVDLPIAAPYGWNLIGSPFEVLYDVNDLKVVFLDNDPLTWPEAVAKNLVAEDVYRWDAASAKYVVAAQIDNTDWQGYWVRVYAPSGVTVLIPGPDNALNRSVHQPGKTRSLPHSKPTWTAIMDFMDTSQRVERLTIGTSPTAKDGFDPGLDKEAPPYGDNRLTVTFDGTTPNRTGGRLMQDIRPNAAGTKGVWNFTVLPTRTEALTMRASLPSGLPKGVGLWLVDSATKERHNLLQRGHIVLSGTAGVPHKYQIQLAPLQTIPLQIRDLRVHSLGRSSGGTKIIVQATRVADATAFIETFSGRRIAALSPSRSVEGTETSFVWDGMSQNGQPSPAGTYLVHVTVTDNQGTQQRMTRPIIRLR